MKLQTNSYIKNSAVAPFPLSDTASGANKTWLLQDAKAKFSRLVDDAMRGEPQHVTRRGKPAVVVLSFADFANLSNREPSNATNFVAHLISPMKNSAGSQGKTPHNKNETWLNTATELEIREVDF